MTTRFAIAAVLALMMTTSALALSCAWPTEVAVVELDSALFGDEVVGDDLGVTEVRSRGSDTVVLQMIDGDGLSTSITFARDGGAP